MYRRSLFAILCWKSWNRILNGEQARNIPGGVGGEGNSYLCYPVLKSYNIPSSRYPDDAVYIDKPQTFFQQHYVKIIASSVFYYF